MGFFSTLAERLLARVVVGREIVVFFLAAVLSGVTIFFLLNICSPKNITIP
jgi:hypothetical protein